MDFTTIFLSPRKSTKYVGKLAKNSNKNKFVEKSVRN
jgi:hypothetical protein